MSEVPSISGAARRLAAVPPAAWFGITLLAALMVIVWHRYALDPEDRDWLDPGQPPLNVEVDMSATIAGVTGRRWRAPKPYVWGTLTQHPNCWVGDC